MKELMVIEYQKVVTPDQFQDLANALERLGTSPKIQSTSPGPQMAAEWALPALLSVWIAKPFIDAFLKKLGERSGDAVVSAVAKAIKKLQGHKVAWHRESADPLLVQPDTTKKGAGLLGPALTLTLEVDEPRLKDDVTQLTQCSFVFPMHAAEADITALEAAVHTIPEIIAQERANQASHWMRVRAFAMYGYNSETNRWEPDEHYKMITQKLEKMEELIRREKEKEREPNKV